MTEKQFVETIGSNIPLSAPVLAATLARPRGLALGRVRLDLGMTDATRTTATISASEAAVYTPTSSERAARHEVSKLLGVQQSDLSDEQFEQLRSLWR